MHVGDGAEPQLNKISDRGAKALAAALQRARCRSRDTQLEIGDEGAKPLAEAVGKAPLPRTLAQQQRDWRRGRMALAEAVGKGALPKLKELGLHNNQIGDEGAVALAEAVGKGALPKLKELHLGATSFLRRQRTR